MRVSFHFEGLFLILNISLWHPMFVPKMKKFSFFSLSILIIQFSCLNFFSAP